MEVNLNCRFEECGTVGQGQGQCQSKPADGVLLQGFPAGWRFPERDTKFPC